MASRTDKPNDDQRRARRTGAAAFMGHWQTTFLAVPAVGTVFWYIGGGVRYTVAGHHLQVGMFDATARSLIIGLDMTCATVLAATAVAIGWKVTRRVPFVVGHVAASIYLVGVALWVTTTVGWPMWWIIGHLFLSATIAGSWNLYRVDALRADSRAKDGGGDDKWAKALGLTHTKPILGKVEQSEFATTIPLRHGGGETLRDAQAALPKVEALAKAIGGRGRVVAGAHAGESTLTVMHRDPFKEWLRWPGLSHPGGSFADPLRTAYYDTGADQWYHLAADPVRSRPRSSIGRGGITGAGKSGDANIELAEVLSRRDAVAMYIDVAKLSQNARWALDMLTLAGDTVPKARLIEQGVKTMVEVRQRLMGAHGFRDWTPEVYTHPALRLPACYLFYDEADKVLASLAEWLATTALSTGVYMSATLPSPDHKNMSPVIRRSIGQWKCFGVGDEYAWTFIVEDGTRAAAPNPYQWRAQVPGAHLLDGAPGVDQRLYPVPARTFRAEHADLRGETVAARLTFEPAACPASDVDALGEAWNMCDPAHLLSVPAPVEPQRERVTVAPQQPTGPDGPAATDDEEDDVDEDDRTTWEPRPARLGPDSEPGDAAIYGQIDPREPFNPDGPAIDLEDDTPRPASQSEADAELDRVIVEMAGEGVTEFGNRELLARCRLWSDSAIARRLAAVADPSRADMVFPPGITLVHVKRGRWRMQFENVPATHGV